MTKAGQDLPPEAALLTSWLGTAGPQDSKRISTCCLRVPQGTHMAVVLTTLALLVRQVAAPVTRPDGSAHPTALVPEVLKAGTHFLEEKPPS